MLKYKINTSVSPINKLIEFDANNIVIDDDTITINTTNEHNLTSSNTITLYREFSSGYIIKSVRKINIPETYDNDILINDNHNITIDNTKYFLSDVNSLDEKTNINEINSEEFSDYLILNLKNNHIYDYYGDYFYSLNELTSASTEDDISLIQNGDFFTYNSLFLYKKYENEYLLQNTKCDIIIKVALNDDIGTVMEYTFNDCIIPINSTTYTNNMKQIAVKYADSGTTFSEFLGILSDDQNTVYITCIDNRFVETYENNGSLYNDVKIYTNNSSYDITIPLQMDSDVNLNQKFNIDNQLINKHVKKSINPIVNMEKCVFEPAGSSQVRTNIDENFDGITFEYGNKTYGISELELVNKITFNFHFRDRFIHTKSGYTSTEGWKPIENGFWNGYTYDSGTTSLKKTNSSFIFDDEQSDLLGYLNFDDDDIKYQKNKIKKTFVRLLFYDSKVPSNQNLLYYSTIYLDSNNLLSKYIKNTNNSENLYKYKNVKTYRLAPNSAKTYNNISVNNEYSIFNEDKRLSSRVSVYNRKHTGSSDGFYLYLFQDYAPKTIPETIYMRVEFNHAGYGQTIPMMMPINENNIPKLITDSDFPYDGFTETESGVTKINVDKYYDDLFIELKVIYDKNKNKYLYFIPRNIKDGEMIFNLYEVKI